MLLPRHPRQMEDSELSAWVVQLIESKSPESRELDYKAALSLDGKRNRIEIGKDITSFANEWGGLLLYGVPETKVDGIPLPEELQKCGLELEKDLPLTIENILLGIVNPPFSELVIKVLSISHISPKVLLMVWHPESWNKPHMVEGYGYNRYYRRGNYQSVPMSEREVEVAYAARRATLDHAEHFFQNEGSFRPIPDGGRFFRTVICPRFPLLRTDQMGEEQFREWLVSNPPGGRVGEWMPFLHGWSFRSHPEGKFYGHQYELCLFHNGALSFTLDFEHLVRHREGRHFFFIDDLREHIFDKLVFPYGLEAFKKLQLSGPLVTQVSLHNVFTLEIALSASGRLIDFGGHPLESESIRFTEETSVTELQSEQEKVSKRLIRRLSSAFGFWPSE